MKVITVFDIGKTTKKCFLFDQNRKEINSKLRSFKTINDEDGFPCENLNAVQQWVKDNVDEIINDQRYELEAINFTTYGASLVHIDKDGLPITPLYNYEKPYPKKILELFRKKYPNVLPFQKSLSPPLGMLNTGLQLFWLKHTQPQTLKRIRYALHFAEYLSYLFTKNPLGEMTNIGCHTGLWDFNTKSYQSWVIEEELDKFLPKIAPTNTTQEVTINGKKVKIGIGIHDSSSALLNYISTNNTPFVLVSTGTWSVTTNPFNSQHLSEKELSNNWPNFMLIGNQLINPSRLFLGSEYQLQLRKLEDFFSLTENSGKEVKFDQHIYQSISKNDQRYFIFEQIHLERKQPEKLILDQFSNFEEAYHQLMYELMELQIKEIEKVIGSTAIQTIYVDGGFSNNEVFMKMLSIHFKHQNVKRKHGQGSALGAAIAIMDKKIQHFFKEATTETN